MDQCIEALGKKLSLTEEEGLDLDVPIDRAQRIKFDPDRILLGRLVTNRQYGEVAIKANLLRLFQPFKSLNVCVLGNSRSIITFEHKHDRTNALEGFPWIFDKHALIIRDLSSDEDPMQADLNWCPFIVQIHDLLAHQRSEEIMRLIGDRIGKYVEAKPTRSIEGALVQRIKAFINVSRPLQRGIRLKSASRDTNWVSFAYERLPVFCFLCGLIGHIEKKCPKRYEEGFHDPRNDFQYGGWLDAAFTMRHEHKGGQNAKHSSLGINLSQHQDTSTKRGPSIFNYPLQLGDTANTAKNDSITFGMRFAVVSESVALVG